jgi:hypothetical protein
MTSFLTQQFRSVDGQQELYVYYRGRLIYKAWYKGEQKQHGRMFHEREGLTQWATAEGKEK